MTLPTDNAARQDLPLYDYMFGYFPLAYLAEVEVAVAGNKQHNPGEPNIRWAREKSTDHMNKAWRHQFDYAMGQIKDTDGTYHLAKAIWRLRAELQLLIEKERSPKKDPELPKCGAGYPWKMEGSLSIGCCLPVGHQGAHRLPTSESHYYYGSSEVTWSRERCGFELRGVRCFEVCNHEGDHRDRTGAIL